MAIWRVCGAFCWLRCSSCCSPRRRTKGFRAIVSVPYEGISAPRDHTTLRCLTGRTLAVVAFQLAKDERLGEAALPALVLVLVGLIPVIFLSRTLNKKAA